MEKNIFLKEAQNLSSKLISYRRELHQYPELSLKEFETTKRIKKWLKDLNIDILDLDLPVGVLAEIKGDIPGPTIALRADIDALPIREQTNLPFASKNEDVMHACGHDFHTSSMIGAAIILNKNRKKIKGNIRLIFQPAEESAVGAKKMIDAGALNEVKAIFGMHNKPEVSVGSIGVKSGPLMASVDKFKIFIKGKGGHAGVPNKNIDPIVAAGHVITSLQTIVSRNIDPLESAVVSICKLEGGTAWNVIPDIVELEGTVRTFSKDTREKIPELMRRIAQNTTKSFGATAKVEWVSSLPSLDNTSEYTKVIEDTAKDIQINVVEANPTLGGEDFSLYLQEIPGFFIWMGTSGNEDWHHPEFTIDEKALPISAAYFAQLAYNVLEKSNENFK